MACEPILFSGEGNRYGELADMPERISTNILADRLVRLEEIGLVTKTAYQNNPARHEYALTRAGADLLSVLQTLAAWSTAHFPGRWPSPKWFLEGWPADFYPREKD